MRAALKNGIITPPTSLSAAQDRRSKLLHEINRIEMQLSDATRALTQPTMRDYDSWHKRAEYALRLFREEVRQIEEWMTKQNGDIEALLADAHAVLKTLESEVDLEPNEKELMVRLERYFAARPTGG